MDRAARYARHGEHPAGHSRCAARVASAISSAARGLLAWGGIAWHFIEFGIALGAGIAASSIALIGFGADSLIEALAGFVVIWLFTVVVSTRLRQSVGRSR